MKTFYYYNGVEVKEYDIVYYSEWDGVNELDHHNDAVYLIIKHNGTLKAECWFKSVDNAKKYVEYDAFPDEYLFLSKYAGKDGVLPPCFQRQGTYPEDKDIMTIEFVNENYFNDPALNMR